MKPSPRVIVVGVEPSSRTLRISLFATKPTHTPSGEKNGVVADSVPGSVVNSSRSSLRNTSRFPAGIGSVRPSGESATPSPVKGRSERKVIVERITGAGRPEDPARHTMVPTNTQPSRNATAADQAVRLRHGGDSRAVDTAAVA